jgi:hypothetical protein
MKSKFFVFILALITTLSVHAEDEDGGIDGMRFANEEEALNWIADRAQALGLGEVSPVTDEAGHLQSLHMSVVDGDTSAVAQAREALLDELGGTEGYIEIAGERIALAQQQSAAVKNSEDACSDDGSFCTHNKSFIRNRFIYREFGASTTNTKGGSSYEYRPLFGNPGLFNNICTYPSCPAGWELDPLSTVQRPFDVTCPIGRCRRSVGSNHLAISVTLFTLATDERGKDTGVVLPLKNIWGSVANRPSLTVSESEWCFLCGSSSVKGICSTHDSESDNGRTLVRTKTGHAICD